MAKQTSKYVAVVGIDFEQLKPPIRVEAGEAIPARVGADEIKDLLEGELIRESEGENE